MKPSRRKPQSPARLAAVLVIWLVCAIALASILAGCSSAGSGAETNLSTHEAPPVRSEEAAAESSNEALEEAKQEARETEEKAKEEAEEAQEEAKRETEEAEAKTEEEVAKAKEEAEQNEEEPSSTPESSPTGGESGEGPGSYSHAEDSRFCSEHECIGDFKGEGGYVVECSDGTYSHAGGISGACSDHGGESG